MPSESKKDTAENSSTSDIDAKIENLKKIQEKDAVKPKELATARKQPDKAVFEKVKEQEYEATIITDFSSKVDPFILTEKDPNFAYRFLRWSEKNLTEKTSSILHQKGGWQLCPKEHLKRIGIPDDRISQEGHYRAGDTVLAFMPKRLFDKKDELKRLEASTQMDIIKRNIRDGQDSGDVNVHESMAGKGFQTAKELGFR
jgi:hypothetical protein